MKHMMTMPIGIKKSEHFHDPRSDMLLLRKHDTRVSQFRCRSRAQRVFRLAYSRNST